MDGLESDAEDLSPRAPVGLFGGSFDPPHIGHLMMARDALEFCGLSKVFLIPAARSPLKETESGASAEERTEMVRLALAEQKGLELLDWEVERGGTSFTIDTVKRFVALYPKSDPFWILGSDQFAQLDRWRWIEELTHLTGFVVMSREGSVGPKPDLPVSARIRFLPPRRIDVSSTEVRRRAEEGLPLEPFVPAAVGDYIRRHQLYGWVTSQ